MKEDVAYTIVKTIFDKKPEIIATHKEAENIDVKTQAGRSPLPFHPGAIKYFSEKGVKVN
ncbi:hypothetical protein D3C83_117820 [compost metagenome]